MVQETGKSFVVEPTAVVSGLYKRGKFGVILDLYGCLLTVSQITEILYF